MISTGYQKLKHCTYIMKIVRTNSYYYRNNITLIPFNKKKDILIITIIFNEHALFKNYLYLSISMKNN